MMRERERERVSLCDDEYRQEGGDQQDDAHHDAGHLVVQRGPGVEEDGVAVEDHDVEAAEVEEDKHDEADDERLNDAGLDEGGKSDLVLLLLSDVVLDDGHLPGQDSSISSTVEPLQRPRLFKIIKVGQVLILQSKSNVERF